MKSPQCRSTRKLENTIKIVAIQRGALNVVFSFYLVLKSQALYESNYEIIMKSFDFKGVQ